MLTMRRTVSIVTRVIAVVAVATAAIVFGGPLVRQKLAVRRMLAAGEDFFDECRIEKVDLVVKDITYDFFDWTVGNIRGFAVELVNKKTSELGVSYHCNLSVQMGGKEGLTFPCRNTPVKTLIDRLERDSANRELIRLSDLKECRIAGSSLVFGSDGEMLAFAFDRELVKATLAKATLTHPSLDYHHFAPFVKVQRYLDTLRIAFDEVERLEYWLRYSRWGVCAFLRQNGDLVKADNEKVSYVHGVTRITGEVGDGSKAGLEWHRKLPGGLFGKPVIQQKLVIGLHEGDGKYAVTALDLHSGDSKWAFRPDFPVGGYDHFVIGPPRRTTSADIAICGSLLLFRYGTREINRLVALRVRTGKEIWRYETANAIATVHDSISVFILEQTEDSVQIKAISPESGSQTWSKMFPRLRVLRLDHGHLIVDWRDSQQRWTHYLAIDGKTGDIRGRTKVSGVASHLFLCDNQIYIATPNEGVIWDPRTDETREAPPFRFHYFSPLCREGNLFLIQGRTVRGRRNVTIKCFDPHNLEPKWENQVGPTEYISALGETLFFNSNAYICKMNTHDGSISRAVSYKNFRDYENAIIAGRYTATIVGKIFYMFDRKDGKILFGKKFGANPVQEIGFSDGRMLLALSNGEIYCYKSPLISGDIARVRSVDTRPPIHY